MDNDFGLAYEQGFKDFADNMTASKSSSLFVMICSSNVDQRVTTLAASNPDVFISMTAGNLAVGNQEAGRSIIENAQAVFTPSVCKSIAAHMDLCRRRRRRLVHRWWWYQGHH